MEPPFMPSKGAAAFAKIERRERLRRLAYVNIISVYLSHSLYVYLIWVFYDYVILYDFVYEIQILALGLCFRFQKLNSR